MEEYVTVLMKKKKIGDHFLMFEPSEMVEGFVDEFGFIDINGNEYCPIDSPEIMNDDIKEGICYYMSKSMIEQRFGNLKEAEKELVELLKRQIIIGIVLKEFKKIKLLTLNLEEYYNRLYQEEIMAKNPELYERFLQKQVQIGQNMQNKDYKELVDFILENLDLILKDKSMDDMKNDLSALKDYIVEEMNEKQEINEVNKQKKLTQAEKQKDYEKTFENLIDLDDPMRYKKIKDVLDKYIVGQEDAKQAVINSLKMNERRQKDTMKINTLLVGPTGCGKTFIAEKLAEVTRKPFLNIDTTELSLPGLVGTSIESKLEALVRSLNFDIKAAENAIVLFDEIDKQATNEGAGMGENVYNTLLGFLQGKKYTLFKNDRAVKPMEFDTKNMTIISTGSFAKFANKNKDDGYHRTNIGFTANKAHEEVVDVEDVQYPTIDGSFLKKAGMPDELVGRVNLIAQLDPMNRNIMRDIILESEESALNKAKAIFKKSNVELNVTDDYIEAVIDKAIKMKTGARSLKFIISESVKNAEYEMLMNPLGIDSITLTKETIENNKLYDVYYNDVKEDNEVLNHFDPSDLKDPYRYKKIRMKLDEYAIGQEDAKKAVIVALKRGEQAESKNERITTILVGPTGCGKTFIAETASKITNRPFLNIDATELSLPGLVGTSIESKLEALVESCDFDINRAQHAIVIFDEIDKPSANKGLNMGESVYHTLLGFLNGKTYTLFTNDRRHQPIEFDTSFLTVISTGSFAKAAKLNKDDKSNSKVIGFKLGNQTENNVVKEDIEYPTIDTEFLKKSGLPNELVGRIEAVEQLQPMTKEMMKQILLDSADSPLIDFKLMFESDNVSLRYTEGFIDALVDQALSLKTGARSLRYVVTNVMTKAAFDVSMNAYAYDAIILTAETVKDNSKYERVRKQYKQLEDPNKKLTK